MEVVKNQIDELNATLNVKVAKEDIAENVEKSLKEYRKNANVAGFRKGHVPVGLIKKMYGNSIIADELNKLVSKSLSEYLVEEKLNILGEPLPSKDQEPIDFAKQENFNFYFDIGVAPEFEIKLTKREKIHKYLIKVDDDMVQKYIESYQQRFGAFENIKKSNEESLLSVNLIELDENKEILEKGINVDDVSVSIKMIKDDEIKKSLIGVKEGDIIDFEIKKAFPNDTEISSILKIDKTKVADISDNFRLSVKEIKDFVKAPVNQELFDKCFGEGVAKSEEDFKDLIIKDIEKSFYKNTKYKMMLDVKTKLLDKLSIELPEEFLKRWIIATNKDVTEEQLEKEFPIFLKDLQWTLIKSKIAKENELKVSEEEMKGAAKEQLLEQFNQYGMSYVPDEYLDKYSTELLSKEQDANRLYEQEIEKKVVDFVVEAIKTEEKELTLDEFQKILS